jgi:hypothetical protein
VRLGLPGAGSPLAARRSPLTFIPVPAAALPPYAIAAPAFRFRALAALCGRAPLGGPREVALACMIGARLAHVLVQEVPRIGDEARAVRATAARAWLASAALPAGARAPMARLYDSTAVPLSEATPATSPARRARARTSPPAPPAAAPRATVISGVVAAIVAVVEAAGAALDGPSRQELLRLAGELTASAPASAVGGRGA